MSHIYHSENKHVQPPKISPHKKSYAMKIITFLKIKLALFGNVLPYAGDCTKTLVDTQGKVEQIELKHIHVEKQKRIVNSGVGMGQYQFN